MDNEEVYKGIGFVFFQSYDQVCQQIYRNSILKMVKTGKRGLFDPRKVFWYALLVFMFGFVLAAVWVSSFNHT